MITEKHHYHNKIIEQYGECQYIQGHISNGKEKNPIWIVNEIVKISMKMDDALKI